MPAKSGQLCHNPCFLHQLQGRSGTSQRQSRLLQECGAFSIGHTEAEAVSALMTKVQKEVAERLCAAVKSRGMAKLLTHDLLSKGLLNLAWTSGIGPTEAWKEELRNRDDGVLVP